jgi:hypothetical protein
MDVKTTFRNLVRDQSVSICMLQEFYDVKATMQRRSDLCSKIGGPILGLYKSLTDT